MTRRISKTTLLFIMAIGLITFDACRKKYYATAEDMAEYGWVLYETKDYLNSNTWFKDAVANNKDWKDSYNGLGWSFAKLMVLDSSIALFNTGLTIEKQKWDPADIQSEINSMEVEGSSGGDMVKAIVSGQKKILSLNRYQNSKVQFYKSQ